MFEKLKKFYSEKITPEFTGIYTLMKSWNINYKFELKQLAPLIPGGELTLFAYPAEWENSAGV